MTNATPATHKAERRPRCPHCRKQFRTSSTKAIFCTRICKDRATAAKKRTAYVAKATDSAFMQTLAFEASVPVHTRSSPFTPLNHWLSYMACTSSSNVQTASVMPRITSCHTLPHHKGMTSWGCTIHKT